MINIFIFDCPCVSGLALALPIIQDTIRRECVRSGVAYYEQSGGSRHVFDACLRDIQENKSFNLLIFGRYHLHKATYVSFIHQLFEVIGARGGIDLINPIMKNLNISLRMIIPTGRSFEFTLNAYQEATGRARNSKVVAALMYDWSAYHISASHVLQATGISPPFDPDDYFLPKSYRGTINNSLFAGPGISFIDFEVWVDRCSNSSPPFKLSCMHRGEDGYKGYPWFSIVKHEAS